MLFKKKKKDTHLNFPLKKKIVEICMGIPVLKLNFSECPFLFFFFLITKQSSINFILGIIINILASIYM